MLADEFPDLTDKLDDIDFEAFKNSGEFEKIVANSSGGTGVANVVRVESSLLEELAEKGIKHTPENVLFTHKMSDGTIVFLEKGNSGGGLEHIVEEHASQFAQKGIPESEIPDAIYQAIKKDKIVGYQGQGTGRPIFEFTYKGKKQRVAITISDNGYVVGANPKSVE